MTTLESCDIEQWVELAENPNEKEFRQAVHTVLLAIASDDQLQPKMVLKGGILLAVRYQSSRFTKDIDLSTHETLQDIHPEEIVERLNKQLATVVESLDYGLDCRVQGHKLEPASQENPTYPSIKIRVGYAYKGTRKHKKLQAQQSASVISIDYSLNELTPNIDSLKIDNGGELLVYSLSDLIAEKFRALLQQAERNRQRRQDIFDLFLVLEKFNDLGDEEKTSILHSLLEKARSRGIEPKANSLDNHEIRERAGAEYQSLADEIEGELPDFDQSYDRVSEFYKSLPWN